MADHCLEVSVSGNNIPISILGVIKLNQCEPVCVVYRDVNFRVIYIPVRVFIYPGPERDPTRFLTFVHRLFDVQPCKLQRNSFMLPLSLIAESVIGGGLWSLICSFCTP